MPEPKKTAPAKRYRALRGVSCRVSNDPESDDYEAFREWDADEEIDLGDAPAHLNIKWLLEVEAIEEITG